MSDELDNLKAENDALRNPVEKLEERVNPPPRKQSYSAPFDYTANASMPASAMKAMVDAVPDAVMKGIRADAQKPNPVTGYSTAQPTTQVQRGSGWAKPIPVEPPPGVALADRLVDHQDRIDKAELAVKLMKAGLKE
jgi:hypothetical protein